MSGVQMQKKSPEDCFNQGVMSQSEGRHQEAVAYYEKAIDLGLRDVALYSNLGLALSGLGQFGKAAETLRMALRLEPDFTSARQNLGVVLFAMGQFDEAKALYRQILAVQPDHDEALVGLSEVLLAQGALDEAEECIRSALAIQPSHVGWLLNFGAVLQAKKRFDEAEDCFRRVVSIAPENSNAHNNLGVALYAQGRLEEAEASYKRALVIDPANSDAHNNSGVVLLDQGRLAEAEESYRRAIICRPDFAKAYFHYVQSKKITRDDEKLVAHLESLAAHSELGAEEKSDVYFALGKCYDDLGEYEQAFLNYEKGHQLGSPKHLFDAMRHTDEVSELISTFDKEFFSQRSSAGSHTGVPIFIVGMPRSGTTLVEQIISSHPAVFGAGELHFLDEKRKEMSLDSIKRLDPQGVLSLAEEYVAHLRYFSSDAAHVIDKMPHNFFHLGLIRLCFPHARIIHCKRNPFDTCLSIYSQKFSTAQIYANNLEDLASYYAQYERLMQHWNEALPGHIFEVEYEELVADQSVMTRKILEFCNLEWDEGCLAFERNKRVVQTASSWHVRQPMYSSSIGRWKHYQSFLGPLMRLES